MDIWLYEKWNTYLNDSYRSGLRVNFEQEVDREVRRACLEFCQWLRKEYIFPLRIRIYVKSAYRIKAMNGEEVCGTFWRPETVGAEPYIRIATGDYSDMLLKNGKDNALAAILWTIAHELTHYFQYINQLELTRIGEERQATRYANAILEKYSETRDHP